MIIIDLCMELERGEGVTFLYTLYLLRFTVLCDVSALFSVKRFIILLLEYLVLQGIYI